MTQEEKFLLLAAALVQQDDDEEKVLNLIDDIINYEPFKRNYKNE